MSDITERLRSYKGPWLVPAEAADEIDNLRADREKQRRLLEEFRIEIQTLTDERDAAVNALERIKNHVDTDEYAYEIAVAAIDAAKGEK